MTELFFNKLLAKLSRPKVFYSDVTKYRGTELKTISLHTNVKTLQVGEFNTDLHYCFCLPYRLNTTAIDDQRGMAS